MFFDGLVEHVSEFGIPLIQLLIPLEQGLVPGLVILIFVPDICDPPLQLLNFADILDLVPGELSIGRHEFAVHILLLRGCLSCLGQLLPESSGLVPVSFDLVLEGLLLPLHFANLLLPDGGLFLHQAVVALQEFEVPGQLFFLDTVPSELFLALQQFVVSDLEALPLQLQGFACCIRFLH